MSKFGENLNDLMKDKNLSTIDIKNLIGISTAQTGRYLSGHYEPTLKNALKICNYFNISLDYMLGIDDIPNRYESFKEPKYEIFIERYYKLMNENKTNHYQVSFNANFNRNNLIYWKKNKVLPTLDIIYKLAILLNTSVEYLIGRI